MRRTLAVFFSSIVAALGIYCGSRAMNGGMDPVPDAAAEDSCAQPSFQLLAELSLGDQNTESPVLDVGGFREIVVYVAGAPADTNECSLLPPQFRPVSTVPFGTTSNRDLASGARFAVDGTELKLAIDAKECKGETWELMVAGIP